MEIFTLVMLGITAVVAFWRIYCGLVESSLRGSTAVGTHSAEYLRYGEEGAVRELRNDMAWGRACSTFLSMFVVWISVSVNIVAGLNDFPEAFGGMLACGGVLGVLVAGGYLWWVAYNDRLDMNDAIRTFCDNGPPVSHPEQLV